MLVTKCNARVCRTDSGNIIFRCITLQLQLLQPLQLQPLLPPLRDMKRNACVGKTHSWSSLFPKYNKDRSSEIGRSSLGTRRLGPASIQRRNSAIPCNPIRCNAM